MNRCCPKPDTTQWPKTRSYRTRIRDMLQISDVLNLKPIRCSDLRFNIAHEKSAPTAANPGS